MILRVFFMGLRRLRMGVFHLQLGRKHSWQDVKDSARSNEWFLQAGRRIVASCYLDSSRPEVKDDAFWAFSAARLTG